MYVCMDLFFFFFKKLMVMEDLKVALEGLESLYFPLLFTRASLVARLVQNTLTMQRPWFESWVGKIPWRRDRLPTLVFLGFPCGSAGKESACNAGDLGSIPEIPWRR